MVGDEIPAVAASRIIPLIRSKVFHIVNFIRTGRISLGSRFLRPRQLEQRGYEFRSISLLPTEMRELIDKPEARVAEIRYFALQSSRPRDADHALNINCYPELTAQTRLLSDSLHNKIPVLCKR